MTAGRAPGNQAPGNQAPTDQAPGYRSPSTGRTVRAVMFDAFGTVVDWRSGISAAVRAFARDHALGLDPDEFADAWRALYQPAMQRIRSGQRGYVSLDVLHRENLTAVLREHDMAAAHNEDLAGARAAGLATAFIARPAEYGPHQQKDLTATADWDLAATSITDLASQLRHARRT